MPTPLLPLDPDAVLPFNGYRRLDDTLRLHDLCVTLSHWYESEKYRGVDEALRLEVLSCPTARAARKVTKRHQDKWRADWAKFRGRVLRAGIAMQMRQSAQAREVARLTFEQAMALSGDRSRIAGIPAAFLAQEVAAVFTGRTDKHTPRLGFLVIQGYDPDGFSERLDAMFQQGLPYSAAVYVGEEANFEAERWCMARAVPLRYVGDASRRLRAAELSDMLQRVNQLVVCAPPARKDVKDLVAQAKRRKVRILTLTRNTRRDSVFTQA